MPWNDLSPIFRTVLWLRLRRFIYLFIYGHASSQDQVSENDIPDCNEQHRLVTDVSANQSAWSE